MADSLSCPADIPNLGTIVIGAALKASRAPRPLSVPGVLGRSVRHRRLWGIALIAGAILPILIGLSLSLGCYITANGQCFEYFDRTVGIPVLIVGGLLIVAGLMILTTARAAR